MDFIKSAASFIAKAGSQFPYDLNEKIPLSSNSVWTLQTGSIRVRDNAFLYSSTYNFNVGVCPAV